MISGELLIALVHWEGKVDWNQILLQNNWPANTKVTTVFNVRNIGIETAIFTVEFMGLKSVGVELSYYETAWFYLYPTTPSPKEGYYNIIIKGNDITLITTQIKVTTYSEALPGFTEFAIASFNKV